MKNFRIKLTAFNKLTDDKLNTFSSGVVGKVNLQTERYKDVKTVFDVLELGNTAYSTALSTYNATGSDLARSAKNTLKEELVDKLTLFGNALVVYANGDETYITDTGMLVSGKSSGNVSVATHPPEIIYLRPTGLSGTISYSLKVANKSRIKTIYMDWSIDEGKTWTTMEVKGIKAIIDNLPSLKTVSFRFHISYTRGEKSPYSEIITVNVN